jgi:hypothetical protein
MPDCQIVSYWGPLSPHLGSPLTCILSGCDSLDPRLQQRKPIPTVWNHSIWFYRMLNFLGNIRVSIVGFGLSRRPWGKCYLQLWCETIEYVPLWPKIVWNGLKCSETIQNGSKCSEMVLNNPKQSKMAQTFQTVRYGPKRVKLLTNGSIRSKTI